MKTGRLVGLEQRQSALELQLRAIFPDYDAATLQNARSTRMQLQESAGQQILSQFTEGGCVVDAGRHLSAEDMRSTLRILISSKCGAERQEAPFLLSGATIQADEGQNFESADWDVLYSAAEELGGDAQQAFQVQSSSRKSHKLYDRELRSQIENLREQNEQLRERNEYMRAQIEDPQGQIAYSSEHCTAEVALPQSQESAGAAIGQRQLSRGEPIATQNDCLLHQNEQPVKRCDCESNALKARSAVLTEDKNRFSSSSTSKRALSCQTGEQASSSFKEQGQTALQAVDLPELDKRALRLLVESAGDCNVQQQADGSSFDVSLSLHSQAEDYDEYCENARREARTAHAASAVPMQSSWRAQDDAKAGSFPGSRSAKCAAEQERHRKSEKTQRRENTQPLTPREYAALLNVSESECSDAVVDLGPSVRARIVHKSEQPAKRTIRLKSRGGSLLIGLFQGLAARFAQRMTSCGGGASEGPEQLQREESELEKPDERALAIKRQIESENASFSTFGTYDLFKQLMQRKEPRMVMIDENDAGQLMQQLNVGQADADGDAIEIEVEDAGGKTAPISGHSAECAGRSGAFSGQFKLPTFKSDQPTSDPLFEPQDDAFPAFRPDGLFFGLNSQASAVAGARKAETEELSPVYDSDQQPDRGTAFVVGAGTGIGGSWYNALGSWHDTPDSLHNAPGSLGEPLSPRGSAQPNALSGDQIVPQAQSRAAPEPPGPTAQQPHRQDPALPLPVRKHSVRYPGAKTAVCEAMSARAGLAQLNPARQAETHALIFNPFGSVPFSPPAGVSGAPSVASGNQNGVPSAVFNPPAGASAGAFASVNEVPSAAFNPPTSAPGAPAGASGNPNDAPSQPRKRRTSAAFLAWQAENDALQAENDALCAPLAAQLSVQPGPQLRGADLSAAGDEFSASGGGARDRLRAAGGQQRVQGVLGVLEELGKQEDSLQEPADAVVQVAVAVAVTRRAPAGGKRCVPGGEIFGVHGPCEVAGRSQSFQVGGRQQALEVTEKTQPFEAAQKQHLAEVFENSQQFEVPGKPQPVQAAGKPHQLEVPWQFASYQAPNAPNKLKMPQKPESPSKTAGAVKMSGSAAAEFEDYEGSEAPVPVFTAGRDLRAGKSSRIDAPRPVLVAHAQQGRNAGRVAGNAAKSASSAGAGENETRPPVQRPARPAEAKAELQMANSNAAPDPAARLENGPAASQNVENIPLYYKNNAVPLQSSGSGLLDFSNRLYNEQAVDGVVTACNSERWRIGASLAGKMMRSYQTLCESRGAE